MGDEKETWKVKTLDEILLEKKRRRELEERTDPKRQKNVKYLKANVRLIRNLHVDTVFKTIANHSYPSYQFVGFTILKLTNGILLLLLFSSLFCALI